MGVELGLEDFVSIFERLAGEFETRRDELNDLDTRLGDGDHGFSMARGFAAARDHALRREDASVGDLLISAGMQFNESAGSTIGILMFSALREAGKITADKALLRFPDLVDILDAAIVGVRKRGKAEAGQKTILDSLIPALAEMRRGLVEGASDEAGVARRAAEAAREGAEATRQMQPAVGRAKWFAQRSEGEIDPGAVSGAAMVNVLATYLEQKLSDPKGGAACECE